MQYEEQLEECKKYREFLLSLTPLEWFEEQAILKTKRDEQRRALASEQGENILLHYLTRKSTALQYVKVTFQAFVCKNCNDFLIVLL